MFCRGVFAIIFDSQQRILLCHRRDSDLWNLPGGRLQLAELVEKGLLKRVGEKRGSRYVLPLVPQEAQ